MGKGTKKELVKRMHARDSEPKGLATAKDSTLETQARQVKGSGAAL